MTLAMSKLTTMNACRFVTLKIANHVTAKISQTVLNVSLVMSWMNLVLKKCAYPTHAISSSARVATRTALSVCSVQASITLTTK